MSVLGAEVKVFARENCNLPAAVRFDKLDPPGNEHDVPMSQLVAKQQGPVLPDQSF